MPNKKLRQIQKTTKTANVVNICGKHYFQDKEVENIQNNILKWYDKEQRILPWREIAKNETDSNIRGYAVWVSEIMLQQTQVATVIPYFNKWIKKWPTVKHLADAELEEVLQMWAGLGYYSRGRRLHEGAKIVMDKLNGEMPDTVPELIKLIPGIGAYSASAIASVAFQKVAGVVDGNVIRVLSRMRVIGVNVSQSGVRDHLWELANKVVSKEKPGDFNQALMELGATVCTPQNPSCAKCPVSSCCTVFSMAEKNSEMDTLQNFVKKKSAVKSKKKSNEVPDIENIVNCDFCMPTSIWVKNPQVTAYPCKVEKKSARQEKVNVIVVQNDEKYLVVKRPEKGLLAGLWEFPSVIIPEDCSPKIKSDASNSLMDDLGVPITLLSSKQHVGEVIHLFSHIHTTYIIDYIVCNNSMPLATSAKETKWISEDELMTEAVSTAMKKVHALLKKFIDNPKDVVKSKKRKLNTQDSKQKSIASFFHKC